MSGMWSPIWSGRSITGRSASTGPLPEAESARHVTQRTARPARTCDTSVPHLSIEKEEAMAVGRLFGVAARLVPILVLVGCSHRKPDACAVACGAGELCPEDNTCRADGYCHASDD